MAQSRYPDFVNSQYKFIVFDFNRMTQSSDLIHIVREWKKCPIFCTNALWWFEKQQFNWSHSFDSNRRKLFGFYHRNDSHTTINWHRCMVSGTNFGWNMLQEKERDMICLCCFVLKWCNKLLSTIVKQSHEISNKRNVLSFPLLAIFYVIVFVKPSATTQKC